VINLKNYEIESQVYNFPDKFYIDGDYGTPFIISNDNFYWPCYLKSVKNQVFLWQIDLNSHESLLEKLPGVELCSRFQDYYTWKNDAPYVCYETHEAKGNWTFHILDLKSIAPMSEMHKSYPMSDKDNFVSACIYPINKKESIITGQYFEPKASKSSFYFMELVNNNLGEIKRIPFSDIPNFENAIDFKPIKNDTKNTLSKKSEEAFALPTAFFKTTEGYFFSYRVKTATKITHEQILVLNSNFELINSTFVPYNKNDNLLSPVFTYSKSKGGPIYIFRNNKGGIEIYSYKDNVLSSAVEMEDDAFGNTYYYNAKYLPYSWYDNVFAVFYVNGKKSAVFTLTYDR
jgi:hypothetical protein